MTLHLKMIWIAIVLLFVNGCTGSGKYLVSDIPASPTNPKDIHIYALNPPDGEYEILGYVSVFTVNANNAGNELRDKLKEQAAHLGANAIVAFKLNLDVNGGGAQGLAIRFK